MRNKCVTNHVLLRNETYYFLKRVPYDLKDYYSVKRLCFSLKTKSYVSALRITKSVLQRLEDYWLGIRLQKMDIPEKKKYLKHINLLKIYSLKDLVTNYNLKIVV